jgi:hypothetical protein
MDEKHSVVISREWNNPKILISVSSESIGIKMSLEDFLLAVHTEMGNPTFLVTKAALLEKLTLASDKVCAEMKSLTSKVI